MIGFMELLKSGLSVEDYILMGASGMPRSQA